MNEIIKLAYFDEQAAVDFLEIKQSGSSSEVIKEVTSKNNEIGIDGEVGKGFLSFFQFGLSGNMSKKNSSLIETQVSRTIYNKFIELSDNTDQIVKYEQIKLKIVKESATYFRNIMPFIKIIDDSGKFENAEELKGINHQELDTIFDDAKGYYEFIGEVAINDKKNETAIIRFNINGMRNNYSLYDLTKMNLSLYGLKVGETNDIDLNFINEMNEMLQEDTPANKELNFDEMKKNLDNEADESDEIESDNRYKIIDVIVAGI